MASSKGSSLGSTKPARTSFSPTARSSIAVGLGKHSTELAESVFAAARSAERSCGGQVPFWTASPITLAPSPAECRERTLLGRKATSSSRWTLENTLENKNRMPRRRQVCTSSALHSFLCRVANSQFLRRPALTCSHIDALEVPDAMSAETMIRWPCALFAPCQHARGHSAVRSPG